MTPLAWADPDARAVAEDALLERGGRYPPLPPYTKSGDGGDGCGDGGGDGGDGYGDGDGDGGGYGAGDGDGGDGDGGYGYGDSDGDGGGYGAGDGKEHNHLIRKGIPVMREGLNIIVSPGGYSPYVRIAWCRRVEGDEWIMIGARIIRRFGRNQQLVNLAAKGPVVGKATSENTDLLDAATEASPIHRLHAIRCEPANEKAWAKVCPKPKAADVRAAVEKALAEMRGVSDWAAE